ncbi:hypothetical protein pesp045 [Peridroma alphabaculovirus]|uniref:Uncharacterized protein n=1 Tax=Peridroma alphabaculovirus TaxID=1346829 RepID=A0A068LRF6_9ABAC|nr:hypothetical protein pesp045 [Peridroma alphabaculovirus]AIE47775.1 hypothetical protein pesp045 [Peridroma alphabaculovirus]
MSSKPQKRASSSGRTSSIFGKSKKKDTTSAAPIISTPSQSQRLEESVLASQLRSPAYEPDLDRPLSPVQVPASATLPPPLGPEIPLGVYREDEDEDYEMDDKSRPTVVFVKPPALNQIASDAANVRDVQLAINTIKLYMDALQTGIGPASIALKEHFTLRTEQVTKLAYKDIMFSIINNNTVNRRNFYAISNLFYHYFVKLFDNTASVAHVIVNVNYTRHRTNISDQLTAFFNLCAHYVVSNIKQLINADKSMTVSMPDEYMKVIRANQITLTNLFNFRLSDLRGIVFYKHTPDNDANTFVGEPASNREERILNVPLHVVLNVPQLYF